MLELDGNLGVAQISNKSAFVFLDLSGERPNNEKA
jgi:hypothetical protein